MNASGSNQEFEVYFISIKNVKFLYEVIDVKRNIEQTLMSFTNMDSTMRKNFMHKLCLVLVDKMTTEKDLDTLEVEKLKEFVRIVENETP